MVQWRGKEIVQWVCAYQFHVLFSGSSSKISLSLISINHPPSLLLPHIYCLNKAVSQYSDNTRSAIRETLICFEIKMGWHEELSWIRNWHKQICQTDSIDSPNYLLLCIHALCPVTCSLLSLWCGLVLWVTLANRKQQKWLANSKPRPQETLGTFTLSLGILPSPPSEQAQTSLLEDLIPYGEEPSGTSWRNPRPFYHQLTLRLNSSELPNEHRHMSDVSGTIWNQ